MSYEANLEQAAKDAITLLKGNPENWIAIATQFLQEKGRDFWTTPVAPFNVGNIRDTIGNFLKFDSLEAGIHGYASFLTIDDKAGYYSHVVDAIQTGTPDGVLVALANSPYCAPKYPIAELRDVMQGLEAEYKVTPPTEPEAAKPQPEASKPEPEVTDENFVVVTPFPSPHGSLWGIASACGLGGANWRELLKLNPDITNPGFLRVGQKVRVK